MTGTCSHSIARRLSGKLALFTMIVLGLLFATSWVSVKMLLMERSAEDLSARSTLIADIIRLEAMAGGEEACLARLNSDAPMRASSRLELWRTNGELFYADQQPKAQAMSEHSRVQEFTIDTPRLAGGILKARFTVDYAADGELGRNWALLLLGVTVAAGALVAVGTHWHVRRQLRPLQSLAAQTLAISPRQLDQRLALEDPAEELLPWVEQFNDLMGRLELAYTQLEGFNADVAHELRTPLANLMGETELALSRERPVAELQEVLGSNLEEMQRLSALVNDMLFLSQADRGAVARRGLPVSLAALASQVVEFHEAPLQDAGLTLRIDGDMQVAVDEPLFKRALSNLIGNAARFAARGSTVTVQIAPQEPGQVRVAVHNIGADIDAQVLPRLFDRFFRADASRWCDDGEQHHGLGLAIVAAIARMHAGSTLAESNGGTTRVGFTLAAA